SSSGQKAVNIHGRVFIIRFSLVLDSDGHSSHPVEVVVRMLPRTADQQVFLFVNHILPVVLTEFEIICQLDGVGRAGLFTEPAQDAAREVDAEKCRITPAVLVLRSLERNAVHRTGCRAQITGYAALLSLRVSREDDSTPEARRMDYFFIGILYGYPSLEHVQQNVPKGLQVAK